ncbi:sporulation protein YqfD [Aminipila butyrica]|nr:sporulation protein YqfD [Aminipila butyrica]
MEHWLLIRIEGFKQQELLSQCMKKNIPLRQIKIKNNIELTMRVRQEDFDLVKKLGKNKYRFTVLSEGGYIPLLSGLLANKARILGIAIFLFIVYFQTLFVSEIRIEGYEGFTEREVRQCLRDGGMFEGSRKSMDLEKLKLYLYDKLDNVAFVGINMKGCLAEVRIVEGTINLEKVDKSAPCHIVADREGYVERVTPIEGIRAVDTGDYVNKGDILIAGNIPIQSTTYGQPENSLTERYVHAEGKVTARIPYWFVYNQSAYERVKKPTGKFFYTFQVQLGEKTLSTEEIYQPYEVSVKEELKTVKGLRPFPFSFSVAKVNEVELFSRERSREEMEKQVNKLIRQEIKEKLPKNTQILNKSLYFTNKKNIIEVAVMIESLQEIGMEQEIVIGENAERGAETGNQ